MESTGKISYAPIYDKEEQLVRSSKLGLIRVHLKAHMDIGDVVDGRRTCLLDYIAYASETGVDEATHVVYLAKQGFNSTKEGCECEYHRKCKVAEQTKREYVKDESPNTPIAPRRNQRIVISKDRTRAGAISRVFSHIATKASEADLASEVSDKDYVDEFSDSWDVEPESDAEPEQRGTESKQRQQKFHMKRDGRLDISKAAARRMDTRNYAIFASSSENRLSEIRKGREKRKFTYRKRGAQSKLKRMAKDGARLSLSRVFLSVIFTAFKGAPTKFAPLRESTLGGETQD